MLIDKITGEPTDLYIFIMWILSIVGMIALLFSPYPVWAKIIDGICFSATSMACGLCLIDWLIKTVKKTRKLK